MAGYVEGTPGGGDYGGLFLRVPSGGGEGAPPILPAIHGLPGGD
jgi:hypothetical protein